MLGEHVQLSQSITKQSSIQGENMRHPLLNHDIPEYDEQSYGKQGAERL
jgi:hypothetical protein